MASASTATAISAPATAATMTPGLGRLAAIIPRAAVSSAAAVPALAPIPSLAAVPRLAAVPSLAPSPHSPPRPHSPPSAAGSPSQQCEADGGEHGAILFAKRHPHAVFAGRRHPAPIG